jgi:ATPase subunit of ABC transporter with duplicated ATPase domains
MGRKEALVRFEDVSFEYNRAKPILDEVNFAVRRGVKLAIMGQNGAGKSTILSLITGAHMPETGSIHTQPRLAIATARQVIPRDKLDLTVRAFFGKCFAQKVYDIDPRIDEVLEIVHLKAPHDRTVRSFSGGQQARLLLASALIQVPDLLLLDEPTNNLDAAGIEHLTQFLKSYDKTVIVISHDAGFLNAFTHGVLYLDVHTRKVEQYPGNYNDVLKDIAARIEAENRKNAQLEKEIQRNKDKANFFGQKGGKMRVIAKKMRDKVEEMEEEIVEVQQEDRTIREFSIPVQPDLPTEVVTISALDVIRDHKPKRQKVSVRLKKSQHLLLKGPNGIGKSTLLQSIVDKTAKGVVVAPEVRIGYYRQDFSTLDYEQSVFESLMTSMKVKDEERMRKVAAGFLLTAETMKIRVGSLSEGQKGLLAFARLVLWEPGLLLLNEPTNHINFRHIPVIARALDTYKGPMILVSHVPEFVQMIRIDEELDLAAK